MIFVLVFLVVLLHQGEEHGVLPRQQHLRTVELRHASLVHHQHHVAVEDGVQSTQRTLLDKGLTGVITATRLAGRT